MPSLQEAYFGELDPTQWGLIPVAQLDSYKGLYFATFDATAPPLLEYLGEMTWYLDAFFDRREGGIEVFPGVHVQIDYFHVLQNVWRHMWKGFVSYRKQVAARAEQSKTPWYKAQLKALAFALWEHRYVIFKAEDNLSAMERGMLVGICEADQEVGKIRSFLSGVWNIFEDSTDDKEAREALEKLKRAFAQDAEFL